MKRVLVVGDVFLDKYLFGEVSRISPEASVPVVNYKRSDIRLGGAANVALNVRNLGVNCGLVALVGADEQADEIEAKLNEYDIDSHLVRLEEASTIVKLRILSQYNTQIVRVDYEERLDGSAELKKIFSNVLEGYDIVVFSDYLKGTLAEVQELIKLAKAKGKFVITDPKDTDYRVYDGSDVITPNFKEFQGFVGSVSKEDSQEISTLAKGMISSTNIKNVLITMSEKGMMLVGENEGYFHAIAKNVFDVSGAGDTVVATIAAYLAQSETLLKSTEIANVAASLVVAKQGTYSIGIDELEQAMRAEGLNDDIYAGKWTTREHLSVLVEDIRSQGKKIVFTNGCFDILHRGHVRYLQKARKLADVLVIAVNTDASIKALKGDARPINDLDSRILVLSALECVDHIIEFDENTPLALIKEISPDILVKGADYRLEDVVGAPEVMAAGGEVKLIKLENGFSTTSLLKKITD